MIQSFQININADILADLNKRLSGTRWTDELENTEWQYGTNSAYLKELLSYWQNEFDWKKQETYLNSFAHFKTTIRDTGIHFIHEKGKGKKSVPLLLTHGFPDSFVRFLKIIPLLTEPDENGFSFDLIIPSIPGYGYSDIPKQPGMNPQKVADLFAELMAQLGYDQYFAHGGDWGSSITEQLALNYPDNILGIHLTDLPFHHLFTVPETDLSEAEKKYLETGKQWQMTEGGYAMIQSTKPQTLGYGLNDSPAGLASWIIEKFYKWSDCNGNLENSFTKDELLTNLTIYWATQTINSAIRIYYETMKYPPENSSEKVKVPTAAAIFPKDLITAPKEFADRFFNIKQWTQMPKGGHFAAMEQPELLASDIRKFCSVAEVLTIN